MSTVQTIRGRVDSSELGATLSHEHLAPQPASAGLERMAGWYDEDATIEADIAALRKAKQAGIDSLIDLTPLDLGRQIAIFQRVAEADTGVHVVAATGVYRYVPMHFLLADVDAIAEFFLREIEDGIEGTSIRAGIIKIAWDLEASLDAGGPVSPRGQLEKTARAAARAARAGGVPISCHTRAVDELGTPLLDIFEDEGLDLAAVTIGHTNDSSDLDYIKGIAARGANVGLDRYSMRYDDAERERRAGIALALARAGYAEADLARPRRLPDPRARGRAEPRMLATGAYGRGAVAPCERSDAGARRRDAEDVDSSDVRGRMGHAKARLGVARKAGCRTSRRGGRARCRRWHGVTRPLHSRQSR